MNTGPLTRGELRRAARDRGIDPDQPTDALREQLDINECKWCDGEYVDDLWDGFCSDGCQVEYINEYHK